MARLFISQGRLDVWSGEQKIKLEGEIMTLAADGRSFRIQPAVRFVKVSGAEEDPNSLIERVKTEAELTEMGADCYMESVILGEVAYDVQPGFLGDPIRQTEGS